MMLDNHHARHGVRRASASHDPLWESGADGSCQLLGTTKPPGRTPFAQAGSLTGTARLALANTAAAGAGGAACHALAARLAVMRALAASAWPSMQWA
jgi:hypothetical protein